MWAPLAPLFEAAVTANEAWWNFELSRVRGRLLMYEHGTALRRHTDIRCGYVTCKLGATVQLTDGDAYRGGDFIAYPEANWQPENGWTRGEWRGSRVRGTVVVHPSYVAHKVTPVRGGRRWSATILVHGPRPFR